MNGGPFRWALNNCAVLTTLIPGASNCYFCPIFTCFLRKDGPCSFPLGREQLCCATNELLGKQTRSSKAKRHHRPCKELQDQQCHHFRIVVPTTSIAQASNCDFCPIFTCLLRKYGLWSFALGREPWCCSPSELLGKQTCSLRAERHRTTCKGFQHQQCQHFRDAVLTTLISGPKLSFLPHFHFFLKKLAAVVSVVAVNHCVVPR